MRSYLTSLLLTASAPLLMAQQRPQIVGLEHISLWAHDYEKSRSFYRDFLGFEEPYSLKNADGSPSVTFFKINDRQYIQISPEGEPNSDRLDHYGLQTDNAEALRAYLASKGIAVPAKVKKARVGVLSFTFKDPEGRGIEVVQYTPDSWPVREKGKYMPTTRISQHMMHVGFVVTKIEEELKFYEDILGFRETWRGSSNGTTLSWINLKLPDSDDYIELMLFKTAPAPDKRGTSNHLCLDVPSVEAAVATLDSRPDRKDYARPIEIHLGKNRKQQANLYDADNTRTEVMEPHTIDGKPTPSSTAPLPN